MLISKLSRAASVALTLSFSTLGAAQAHTSAPTGTAADYGSVASTSAPVAQRIVLTPATRSVNVNNGDTVEFVVNGKSFRWHFDTYSNETNFKLSKIAPADVAVDGVKVFVGVNPTYRGY